MSEKIQEIDELIADINCRPKLSLVEKLNKEVETLKKIDRAIAMIREESIRMIQKTGDRYSHPVEACSDMAETINDMWDSVEHGHCNTASCDCVRVGSMSVKFLLSYAKGF